MERTRKRLYRLIDDIPHRELHAVERFPEFVREKGDPFLRTLANTPVDDDSKAP